MEQLHPKKEKVLVIAHRGASALVKYENTIDSFEKAIAVQADMVEFDVRRTKDDRLIVFHDPKMEGMPVGSLTYEELNRHARRKGYRVPLLEEVLRVCQGKICLDVELKETGFERRVVQMIKKRYSYEEFSIKSFLDCVSKKVKAVDPRVQTGLLVGRSKANFSRRWSEYFPVKRIRKCKADFVSPHYYFVTKEFMRRMRLHHIPVYVWTVNNRADMEKFRKRGVTGIITDYPNLAVQAFA